MNKALLMLIVLILLIGSTLIIAPLMAYKYEGVEYKFDAEVSQCGNMYNKIMYDSQTDLINMERTNEDNLVSMQTSKMEKCEKIMGNPAYYLKGRYISFWWSVVANILFVILITGIIVGGIWINVKANRYGGDEDDEDDDSAQTYY